MIFCSNGQQLTLPSVNQSSQSSPSTSTPTLMYNPTQGLVYATSGTGSAGSLLADGLILNLGQNHSTGAEFLINNINNSAFSQVITISDKNIFKIFYFWLNFFVFVLKFRFNYNNQSLRPPLLVLTKQAVLWNDRRKSRVPKNSEQNNYKNVYQKTH